MKVNYCPLSLGVSDCVNDCLCVPVKDLQLVLAFLAVTRAPTTKTINL